LEDEIMKKSMLKTTGIILLAAPFMALASDTSLDDAYSYESLSSFDTPVAHNNNIQKQDVNTTEMYAWEVRDTYEFDRTGPSSSERVEIAVFSETERLQQIELPAYTGEYGGDDYEF
jgi:hypothetical protein